MDWKKIAAEDLRNYKCLQDSLKNLSSSIQNLEQDSISIRSGLSNTEPVKGGGTKQEDRLINTIVKKERMRLNYKTIKDLISMIDIGLNNLNDKELRVIQYFYMQNHRMPIECFCDKLGYEKTRIYEIKKEALKKFTITMYGIIDL